MKFFTLYSAKYKKTGFKSTAREDATFHSTFISHTQIGGKLEDNLRKLLKKHTIHVLHQTTVLRRTTEEDYNTPFGVSEQRHAMRLKKWRHSVTQERSRDVPDVVDKKETAFSFVLYKILAIL